MIKSDRSPAAQRPLRVSPGMDPTWDVAIQRAGLLWVQDTHEPFSAVETLSHIHPPRGEKLMITSSGAAPTVLALGELWLRNGKLVVLNEETRGALRQALPVGVETTNPLDLRDDASSKHYRQAMNILSNSQGYDALLVIHSPGAAAPGMESASALIGVLKHHPHGKYVTVLINWCGELPLQEARCLFSGTGLPTYRAPEGTITAFMHMVEYRRDQRQLRKALVLPDSSTANTSEAYALLQQAIDDGTTMLDTREVSLVLRAYGIYTLPTWIATDSARAACIAKQIGYLVALKLRSPGIPHKLGVQGVVLYLHTVAEVQQAADMVIDRVRLTWSQAHIHGPPAQSVTNRADAQEPRVAVEHDLVFGPLIMLGEGGVEWRAKNQAATVLPPLNMNLARYLAIQAIKNKKIRGCSALRPLDIAGLSQLPVQVSNLIVNCPKIQRLNIHPLLASNNELTAPDVMLGLAPFGGNSGSCLAIRSYPCQQEEWVVIKNGGRCPLRPILPEDEPQLLASIAQVAEGDFHYRYFSEVNEFTHDDLTNMTQIDCNREMAFVAVRTITGESETLGVTRAISGPDSIDAEFAILVRSGLKGLSLGRKLLEKLIAYTQSHGLQRLNGITMPNNRSMIGLARKLGFTVDIQLEDGIVNLSLPLGREQSRHANRNC